MTRKLVALTMALVLTACAAPKIPTPDPTPLTSINSSVQLDSNWSINDLRATSKKSRAFVALRPGVDGKLLIAASPDGTVIARNRQTGALVWSIALGQNIASGVGVDDGVAVVVSDQGMVHALNTTDGAKRWEYQLREIVFAPPLVYRERVVLRTIDGNLFALSITDGEFLWDAIYDQPEFLTFGSTTPVGFANFVIIGNALGRVIATDLISGFEIWQLVLGSERSTEVLRNRESRPVVYGDSMILSDLARAIVTYNLSTGNVRWESRRPAGRYLAVDESATYGHNTDGLLFALKLSDGEEQWQQNALLHRGIDEIALVEGRLVVADGLGFLHVIDPASGDLIGRYPTRDRVATGGFLADENHLYVTYQSGRIEALALRTISQ